MGLFESVLRTTLSNFELQKAVDLSYSIHDAESNGYKVTVMENRLWSKLTLKIMEMGI